VWVARADIRMSGDKLTEYPDWAIVQS